LGRDVAITSRNADEKRIIGSQDIGGDDRVASFGRGMHPLQNFVGKGFLYSGQGTVLMTGKQETGNITVLVNVCLSAGFLDTSFLRFGHYRQYSIS